MDVKISKELFARALECKNVDELLAFCKKENIQLSKEDAEKFLAQVNDQELELNAVSNVAGGEFCVGAVSGTFCVGIGI